jgi:hypothetical protein
MAQLGQELSSFAQQLVQDAEARRSAVARIRSETQRMRGQFSREIRQTARDVEQLSRDVTRTLTDNRRSRLQVASEDTLARRQLVSRLQRQIARDLESHRGERVRGNRRRARDTSYSLQLIRRRVLEIKGNSQRFTHDISTQMQNGRQALARARREILARRQSLVARASFERPLGYVPEGLSSPTTALHSMRSV